MYEKVDSLLLDSDMYFKSVDNLLWQSKVLSAKGFKEVYKRDYKTAQEYYEKSLAICKNLNDIDHTTMVIGNLGLSKQQLGLYPEALDLLYSAVSMDGSSLVKAKNYALMGQVYILLKDWEFAEKHTLKSIELKRKIGLESSLAYSYSSMGKIHKNQLNFGEALKSYEKGLMIAKQYDIKRLIGDFLGSIGNVYSEMNEHDKANIYYDEQLNLAEEGGNQEGIYLVNYNRGFFAFKAKQYDKALQYLLKGYEISNKESFLSHLVDNNAMLANTYEALGNVKKAKFHEEQYYIFKDSISNIKKIKKIGAIEQKHLSKKEEESPPISKTKNENFGDRFSFLSIGVIAIFFAVLLWFYRKNISSKSSLQDKKQDKIDRYFDELFLLLKANQTSPSKLNLDKSDSEPILIKDMAEFLKENHSTGQKLK